MWHFFQSVERQSIDPLDAEAARKFVEQLNPEERQVWFAWRAGYKDWVKVADCEDLIQVQHEAPPPAPPAPPLAAAPKAAAPQVAASREDRRKHSRVELRLKVVVLTEDKKTFRSFTKDVSLGGLMLESPLPWPVPKQACEIYIADPGGIEAIQFRAKILSDSKNPLRIEFQETEGAFLDKLNHWIATRREKLGKAA